MKEVENKLGWGFAIWMMLVALYIKGCAIENVYNKQLVQLQKIEKTLLEKK